MTTRLSTQLHFRVLAALCVGVFVVAQDELLSKLYYGNLLAPEPGWKGMYADSPSINSLSLSPMGLNETVYGTFGWCLSSTAYCFVTRADDIPNGIYDLAAHPLLNPYCSPALVYTVSSGATITGFRWNFTRAAFDIGDGVELLVYADDLLCWRQLIPPLASFSVAFNATPARSNVTFRIEPRATYDQDFCNFVLEVFGVKPAPSPSISPSTSASASASASLSPSGSASPSLSSSWSASSTASATSSGSLSSGESSGQAGDELISRVAYYNVRDPPPGWAFTYATSPVLVSLPALSPMSLGNTAYGTFGWCKDSSAACFFTQADDIPNGIYDIAVHPSLGPYCSPVGVYTVPTGVNVTRLQWNFTRGNLGAGDGVELLVYADDALRWRRFVPPLDRFSIAFNSTPAQSNVSIRVDARTSEWADATNFVLDVFGVKPTPSPSVSPSTSASTSTSASVTASGSVFPSVLASGSVSASVTASCTVAPSISTATATPSGSQSASQSASASASVSSSAPLSRLSSSSPAPQSAATSGSSSASASPALPSSLELVARFDGPLQRAAVGMPVTIASSAAVLPRLRVSLAQGCVAEEEASLLCSASDSIASAPPLLVRRGAGDEDATLDLATHISRVAAAAGPALRIAPAVPVNLKRPAGTSCIPVDVAFTLLPHRSWPSHAGSADDAGPCSGKLILRNSSAADSPLYVPFAAALAYAQSTAQVVAIRCELWSAADGNSGRTSALLAVADAAALVPEPALPVPRDILIYRPLQRALSSLRTARSVPLLPADAALCTPSLSNATAGGAAPILCWSVPGALSESAPGSGTNVTQLALHHALASAAHRAAWGSGAASPSGTLTSLPVPGRAVMVVVLDNRAALQRPHVDAEQRMQEFYSAAVDEVLLSRDPASKGNSTVEVKANASACTASSRAQLLSLLRRVSSTSEARLTVRVGGRACTTLWTSPDGSQIHVETPPFAALCSGAASCGHQAITVAYETASTAAGQAATTSAMPPAVPPWARIWLSQGADLLQQAAVSAAAAQRLRELLVNASASPISRTVSCPPWCPPLIPTASVPLALPSAPATGGAAAGANGQHDCEWLGTLVPASAPEPGSAAEPVALEGWAEADGTAAARLSYASGGLFYTRDCSAAGFISADTGVCGNASDPLHRQCAFIDAAGECTACPANVVCPGGARAIPYPGFYTPAESSGLIRPCRPPALERCVGWDDAAGAVRCGVPYSPQSLGCGACAVGWYPSHDGSCSRCPASDSLAPVARAIGLFIAAALTVVGSVLFFTWALALAVGGTVQGGFARSVDLLVWTVMLLQVVAQVGRTAAPGLPPAVQSLFLGLAALQLEDVALPSACWRMYPFTAEVLQCAAGIGLMLALAVLQFSAAPVRTPPL